MPLLSIYVLFSRTLAVFNFCSNWDVSVDCCLSNAVHGQNINLPMYVRLCVSVTLSVNSPTGQTLLRIFTVASLKDADLSKDVLFGGLDDE